MSTPQDRLKAATTKETQAWLEQGNWGSQANKDLMRAIIALDPEAAKKAFDSGAQIDFTPPSSKHYKDHLGSPVGVEPGSPWLGYTITASRYDDHCAQPDRVGVISVLLANGAKALDSLPGEEGDLFILNALMDHASPDLVATLAKFEPRLSATWPVSAIGDGAGPLAHALLNRYEIAIFGDEKNGARPHLDRENAAAGLLELGSRWDEFTRGAVLTAAAGSSSVSVLELLAEHGCRLTDMTAAERTAVQDNIDLMSRVYPDQSTRWAEWIQAMNAEPAITSRRRASP